MKIAVALGMLVRMEKRVVVEVPDNFHALDPDLKADLLSDVYRSDEGEGFVEDNSWGCEEASHHVLQQVDNNTPAQFIIKHDKEDVNYRVSTV